MTRRTTRKRTKTSRFEKITQSIQKIGEGKEGRHKDCDEADSAAIRPSNWRANAT
jgi:hypothetical protein